MQIGHFLLFVNSYTRVEYHEEIRNFQRSYEGIANINIYLQRSRSNIGKHLHYDKYQFSRFVYLIKRERNNTIDMMKNYLHILYYVTK